jgi:hypothetical protein
MTTEIKLICTDRGQHPSADLDTVRVEDDGSFDVVNTRMAPAPWANVRGARMIVDRESHVAPRRVLSKSESRREDYEGRWRWRRQCERCRRDVPLNKKTMSRIIARVLAADQRVVDVSWLP